MTDADMDAVVWVSVAQDLAWWGAPHGDADDVQLDIDRGVAALGSRDAAMRLAVVGEAVVGVGVHLGHGQTTVFADPAHGAGDDARGALVDWLLQTGATELDSPPQDTALVDVLTARGLVASRSSFELERDADLSDLPPVAAPDGIEVVAFDRDVDAEEVHEMIYSVWTDVPGHTHRGLDEWRDIFVGGPRFDSALVVLARRIDGDRRAAGVAVGKMFDDVGWVMQIAVGRPDRSIGLGRMLLVDALHRLADVGARRLGLNVEAVNETALGLYRSVGLEVVGEWQHFTLP